MKQRDSFQLSGAQLRRAVILMFISLGVMVCGLACIYFAPLPWGPWMSLALYLGLARAERGVGVTSPVTVTMIVANLVMGVTALFIVDYSLLAIFATVIHLTLAVVTGIYQWRGLPFTAIYTQGEGYHELHELNSLAWIALFLAAAAAAYFFAPTAWSIYVPFGLMVFGGALTLFLHFATMGPKHERQKSFDLGDFTFTEVEGDAAGLDKFYRLVASAFRTEFQRSFGRSKAVDADAIIAKHKETDARLAGSMVRFLATKGDRPVGAVALYFDHPSEGLPIETIHTDIGINELREDGLIAEVCRLSIANNYRNNPTLFKGLVRCMIDLASDRQVAHLVNDAFVFRLGTYRKIGFAPITDQPTTTSKESLGFGVPKQALALDYKRVVLLENVSATTREMYTVINLYLTERYFNRLVVRDICAKALKASNWLPAPKMSATERDQLNG